MEQRESLFVSFTDLHVFCFTTMVENKTPAEI
jgi:hypothetical protein